MYLASEIWKQYVLYASGNTLIKKDKVILLKNLKFSLTDIDNLVIDQNSVKLVDSERVSMIINIQLATFNSMYIQKSFSNQY